MSRTSQLLNMLNEEREELLIAQEAQTVRQKVPASADSCDTFEALTGCPCGKLGVAYIQDGYTYYMTAAEYSAAIKYLDDNYRAHTSKSDYYERRSQLCKLRRKEHTRVREYMKRHGCSRDEVPRKRFIHQERDKRELRLEYSSKRECYYKRKLRALMNPDCEKAEEYRRKIAREREYRAQEKDKLKTDRKKGIVKAKERKPRKPRVVKDTPVKARPVFVHIPCANTVCMKNVNGWCGHRTCPTVRQIIPQPNN